MSFDAILAECELEPRLIDVVRAEAAAVSSLEHLQSRVLANSCGPREVWIQPTAAPPLNCEIELLVKRLAGSQIILQGWASRRFLGGRLTFWTWHNGRCHFIRPLGWRATA
jgi:hypothetical protein